MTVLTKYLLVYLVGMVIISFTMSYKPTTTTEEVVDKCAYYTTCQSGQK